MPRLCLASTQCAERTKRKCRKGPLTSRSIPPSQHTVCRIIASPAPLVKAIDQDPAFGAARGRAGPGLAKRGAVCYDGDEIVFTKKFKRGKGGTVMRKKLVFLDIDGTLCEAGQNTPPASALAAIRQARANGHLVALCSGRNYGMLSPLLRYGFDAVVASAGGYILAGGSVLYDCPMTPAQQQKALAVLQKNGVFITVEGRMNSYTDTGFKEFIRAASPDGANSELLRWQQQLEAELGIQPMESYAGEAIYKIIFMSPGMQALIEPMRVLGDEFAFCIQEPTDIGAARIINGELINRRFNKGTGVQRLAADLGIPIGDTIAFGDSMNDLEMIEAAGTGVCMANGNKALQARADMVCPAVREDGLATAFESLGLLAPM